MSAIQSRADSASIDLGSVSPDIIDFSILFKSDNLDVNIEKEAVKLNVNSDVDNKCIINFFKIFFCIAVQYKNTTLDYDVIDFFKVSGICSNANILYLEFKYIFKSCVHEHTNVLEARLCTCCLRRFNEAYLISMNRINTIAWKPSLKFGIAASYLHNFALGLWFECVRCLPHQDVAPQYFSD